MQILIDRFNVSWLVLLGWLDLLGSSDASLPNKYCNRNKGKDKIFPL